MRRRRNGIVASDPKQEFCVPLEIFDTNKNKVIRVVSKVHQRKFTTPKEINDNNSFNYDLFDYVTKKSSALF